MKFIYILDLADAKLFWEAMTSLRSPKSEGDAITAIKNVLGRVDSLPDFRSRQLIGETLEWARDNIGRFLFWEPSVQERYGHLPNVFTLASLFESISQTSKDWNSMIDTIVHDQQSQFQQTMHQWHSFLMTVNPERILHFGDTPIQFPDIRTSRFDMADSRTSAGLQVVDIVLWIIRRVFYGNPIGQAATKLYDATPPYSLYEMSLEWVSNELHRIIADTMDEELSAEQLALGEAWVGQFEQRRQHRIDEDRIKQPPST